MDFIKKFKDKAKKLTTELNVLYYSYKDNRSPLLAKLFIILTLGYALSPIDLIPDFIPFIGYLDDLIIIPFLIILSIKFIPKKILEESRSKAKKVPLRLKDNWFFGILFIIIWIFLLSFIIFKILKFLLF